MIDCDIWPMNLLTRASGADNRKLLVHPKEAVTRSGIRKIEGELNIVDPKSIKIPSGTYYVEEKEQGHRHFYCRDSEGEYHVYGRRLNVNGTYTDIMPKLIRTPFPEIPNNTVIDMELVWPGHKDTEIPTAIKSFPDELRMKAFAVPINRGELCILEESYSYEDGRLVLMGIVGDDNTSNCVSKVTLDDARKTSELQSLLISAESSNIEGYVLKSKACDGWWKLKGVKECDVFIVGFKISESATRTGLVTGVDIAVMDAEENEVNMGKCAGFTQELQKQMADAYNEFGTSLNNPYMHRVMRVVYQEIAGQGKMKHGFFDGWRDDKNRASCTIDQFDFEEAYEG